MQIHLPPKTTKTCAKTCKILGPLQWGFSKGRRMARAWLKLLLARDKTVTKAGLPVAIHQPSNHPTIQPSCYPATSSCLWLFPGNQARRNKIKRVSRAWWHQHTPLCSFWHTQSPLVLLVLRSSGPPNSPRHAPRPVSLFRRPPPLRPISAGPSTCVLLYLTRRLCDPKPFKWQLPKPRLEPKKPTTPQLRRTHTNLCGKCV